MAVYFIRNARGHVKIGTARNVEQRLAALQAANSEPLVVIREIDGAQHRERWLHAHFSSLRLIGEWFTFADSMLTVVPPPESQLLSIAVANSSYLRRVHQVKSAA